VTGTLDDVLLAIGSSLTSTSNSINNLKNDVADITSHSALLEDKIASLELSSASASAKLAQNIDVSRQNRENISQLGDKVNSFITGTTDSLFNINKTVADLVSQLNSNTSETASSGNTPNDSNLTPYEALLTSASTNQTDVQNISDPRLATALTFDSATVSKTFRSIGKTYLGNTNISGILSVEHGVIISQNSISNMDTLYLQNEPLAGSIDMFNGAVIIERDGTITAMGNINVGGNLNVEGSITTSALAAENINRGDVVYISSSGQIKKADSTNIESIEAVGIAASDAVLGQKATIIIGGKVKGLASLVAGKKYYLGENGSLTTDILPNAVKSVSVGTAFSESELVVQISSIPINTANLPQTEIIQSSASVAGHATGNVVNTQPLLESEYSDSTGSASAPMVNPSVTPTPTPDVFSSEYSVSIPTPTPGNVSY
jgi:hypothetical protein